MNEDEYQKFIRQQLRQPLATVLQLTSNLKPQDPTAFIAEHLRHQRLIRAAKLDKASQYTECSVCNVASQSDLFTVAQEHEKRTIVKQISDVLRTMVDDKYGVLIVDAWNVLSKQLSGNLHWWYVAEAMCNDRKPEFKPLINRKAWKTVRVFVSSTFRDMHYEREWLVKQVFPLLRAWCARKRLYLFECDLRWGVPKDSTSKDILGACLNEIDRCKAENELPFFVGLLGERYGWVPSESQFPDDLRRRYCWMPGMSVTSVELFTGAVWDNNPHAIVMFRDKSVVDHVHKVTQSAEHAEQILSGYCESEQQAIDSLEALKRCLQTNVPAHQIGHYTCNVTGLDDRDRLVLTGLESLGDRVLQFLKSAIEEQYGSVSAEAQTLMELQHAEHEEYMENRGLRLFGRDREIGAIMQYISQKVEPDEKAKLLVVSGSPGTGKSALMANVAKLCLSQAECDYTVVYHFVGATPGSTSLARLLARMWYECLHVTQDEIPSDFNELRFSLDLVLRRASAALAQTDKARLVVLIDGLNQLDDDSGVSSGVGDGDGGGSAAGGDDLFWLVKRLPANVRVVVSTLQGRCLDQLVQHDVERVLVEALDEQWRGELVCSYLGGFNKKLAAPQLHALLAKTDAGRPLWLTLACEELRVFGTFEQVDAKIASLADQLGDLIGSVIERVVGESTVGGDLVQAALSLIGLSRFGLTESELLHLLALQPTLAPDSKLSCVQHEYEGVMQGSTELPMQTWSIIFVHLTQFLRPVASSSGGRIDFYHRSISKVVQLLMLGQQEVVRFFRTRLVDYFQHSVSDYERKAEELPYQLIQLGEHDRLRSVLVEHAMFEQLYKDESKMAFLGYLRTIGSYQEAGWMYLKAFKQWTQSWFPDAFSKHEDAVAQSEEKPILQWASAVIEFTSQYSETEASASRLVSYCSLYPLYGHSPEAWSPGRYRTNEYVVLQFEKPVYVTQVCIYETCNAGAVVGLALLSQNDEVVVIYRRQVPEVLNRSRIFCPQFARPTFKSNRLVLLLDQSAIFVGGQSAQVDAVAMFGYEKEYHADPIAEANAASFDSEHSAEPKLLRQWVKNVPSVSSQFGEVYYAKERLIGRPSYYPNYSSNPTVWAPAQMATSNEFVEVEYETAVYVAAVEVFETTNPGGIRRISARDDKGVWHAIYETDRLQKIEGSRRFTPKVKRTNFKSNALRLDIDQTAAKWSVCIDTVWLYGYEHEHKVGNDEENNEPEELIKRWYPRMYDDELERDEPLRTELQISEALLLISNEEFLKWLEVAVKLAWFLIDIGQHEITEAYLENVVQLTERRCLSHSPPVDISKKLAEAYYAFIVLYTRWRAKFALLTNPIVNYCGTKGLQSVDKCCSMYKRFWNPDDIQLGVVLSACALFDNRLNSEALQLLERKAYKRGLVDLYIRKGGKETNNDDISVPCSYYDKAKELAYSEFGKYHEQTASVHQEYAAAFWNRWLDVSGKTDMSLMEQCLKHSNIELEIREVMLGFNHPLTLRARGMSAMILEQLGRQNEAQDLKKAQPVGLRIEPNWS